MEADFTCQVCHQPLQPAFYFCPNCGKKIKETPPSMTLLTQLGIYALSLLAPPLGLWPAIKYLKQPDAKSKKVGVIAIVMTLFSLVVTFYFANQLAIKVNEEVMRQVQQIQGF